MPEGRTVLQVLRDVSKRMAAMHDAGLVHLNIKPSNIMWFPEGAHWSITDFGCCAFVGEAAPVASTLAYSAPEVVRAYLGNLDCMTAAPAMDCWALGIVALELFTGTPIFDLVQGGPGQVRVCNHRHAMLGNHFLHWEAGQSLGSRFVKVRLLTRAQCMAKCPLAQVSVSTLYAAMYVVS